MSTEVVMAGAAVVSVVISAAAFLFSVCSFLKSHKLESKHKALEEQLLRHQVSRVRRLEDAVPLATQCVHELTTFARRFLDVATSIGKMDRHRQVSEAGRMVNDMEKEFRRYADAHALLGPVYTARFNSSREQVKKWVNTAVGRHRQMAKHHAATVTEFAREIRERYLD